MATPNIKTRSGNRIRVVIDGTVVGAMQDVRISSDFSPEPASGIGDIHSLEFVPTMARHTVSASQLIMYEGTLKSLGFASENGDDVLKGLIFDIEIVSKDTGAVLMKIVGCSYASGDIEIRKHAILTSNATFNALDVVGRTM